MNTYFKHIITVLIAIFLHACAPSVHTDYDRSLDFSKLKSYTFLSIEPSTGNTMLDGPLVHKRMLDSMSHNLVGKGFEQVPSNPDIYIAYQLATRTDYDGNASGFGYGIGYIGSGVGLGVGSGTAVEAYQKVILTISLYQDKQQSILLWRGSSEKRLTSGSSSPEYIDKLISSLVGNILKQYPPNP